MAPSRGHVISLSRDVSGMVSSAASGSLVRRSLVLEPLPALLHCAPRGRDLPATTSLRHGRHAIATRSFAARPENISSSFMERLTNSANKLQSYVSDSDDPYLNLSIEDCMLRKSPTESIILFLYVNRPCVVVGRNQNPWTEVNVGILNAARGRSDDVETEPPGIGAVDLVRRRSGGGTVFHDEGNLNWSIICPRTSFTRDKHAEMVVRALRKVGVTRARVNERHDIVLDQGPARKDCDDRDTHCTAYIVDEGALPRPLKVSGSAYKLTRERALHHATTLLSSPNLNIISQYLRSPAKPFIQAKGVESVSSPIANIGLDVATFKQELQKEFADMYADIGVVDTAVPVDDTLLEISDIRKGYDELRTDDWIWSQTPHFSLRLDPDEDVGIEMHVHHGVIKRFDTIKRGISVTTATELYSALVNVKLQDIRTWSDFLGTRIGRLNNDQVLIAERLDQLMRVTNLH